MWTLRKVRTWCLVAVVIVSTATNVFLIKVVRAQEGVIARLLAVAERQAALFEDLFKLVPSDQRVRASAIASEASDLKFACAFGGVDGFDGVRTCFLVDSHGNVTVGDQRDRALGPTRLAAEDWLIVECGDSSVKTLPYYAASDWSRLDMPNLACAGHAAVSWLLVDKNQNPLPMVKQSLR